MKFTSVLSALVSGAAAIPALASSSLESRKVTHNWAGAVKEGSGWSSVTGTFVVPDISSSAEADVAAFWVGIDGKKCRGVVWQTGVTVRGNGVINGWYEWVPDHAHKETDLAIKAGDKIRLTVTASSTTVGKASIENLTSGKSVTRDGADAAHPLCLTDAEWIVEEFGQKNLANFGTLEFTDASATGASGTVTPEGADIVNIVADGKTRTDCSSSSAGVTCKWLQ